MIILIVMLFKSYIYDFTFFLISMHKLPNNVISILILANQFFNDIDLLHTNLSFICTYWLLTHHFNFDYD
jgi:hypothetical protein